MNCSDRKILLNFSRAGSGKKKCRYGPLPLPVLLHCLKYWWPFSVVTVLH